MQRERFQARFSWILYAICTVLDAGCRGAYAPGEWLEDALEDLDAVYRRGESVSWSAVAREPETSFTANGLVTIDQIYTRPEHRERGMCTKTIRIGSWHKQFLLDKVIADISLCYPLLESYVRPGFGATMVLRWWVLSTERGKKYYKEGAAALRAAPTKNRRL